MFRRSPTPLEEVFLGPWELFETLAEEYHVLGLALPPAQNGQTPWKFRDDDFGDEVVVDRICRRIDELRPQWPKTSYGILAEAVKAKGVIGRLTRWYFRKRGKPAPAVEYIVPLPPPQAEASVATILNHLLTMPPLNLVDLCWRFLDGERGRALRENIPNLSKLRDPVPVRERFNRQVLEIAFAGLIRPAGDRALAELFASVHAQRQQLRDRHWALCLSGGGIRSASFSLGVLQALARDGLLGRFDYLSTVSGGGYVGSWLTAWMSRVGRQAVVRALAEGESANGANNGPAKQPLAPDAAAVRHLRAFSNYLSPRTGIFSPDLWTLIATVLRNLLLNWAVMLPGIAAVLTLPIVTAAAVAHPPQSPEVFGIVLGLMIATGTVLAASGVYFVHSRRPEGGEDAGECNAASPEATTAKHVPKARSERAFLAYCLLPILVASAFLNTAWLWIGHANATDDPVRSLSPGRSVMTLALFAIAIHLGGWARALLRLRKPWSEWKREFIAIVVTGGLVGALIYATGIGIETASDALDRALGKTELLAPWIADRHTIIHVVLALPGYILSLVVAGFVYVGLSSHYRRDEDREWSARYSAWLLMVATLWVVGAGLVLFSGWALDRAVYFASSAIGALVGGASAALLGKSANTPDKVSHSKAATSGLPGAARAFALAFAGPLAVLLTLITLAAADIRIIRYTTEPLAASGGFITLNALLVLLLFGMFSSAAAWLVDVNKFSLHGMYRARLIRAYLGASRSPGTRYPNPFTKFDPSDNVHMHCLVDGVPPGTERPPIHVLNMALNVTVTNNLEWQERKARSFTVTQYRAGSWGLGYRCTRLWADCNDAFRRHEDKMRSTNGFLYGGRHGITLGTSMAISGAAASPNMGYHSSPAVTFLMGLFNARLGWWLGNPGWAGRRSFASSTPRHAIAPIFTELLGLTSDSSPYVYLSDGGHFENLGLYEMVLRRAPLILAIDASCDQRASFEDLGNAIRKIRVDFGIPVTFDANGFTIKPRNPDGSVANNGSHVAFGRIDYSAVDPNGGIGHLIYIKPTLTDGVPRDVLAYAAESRSFPHESTVDQFYGEQQLESYRALGDYSISALKAHVTAADPTGMLERLLRNPHQQ